MPFNRNFFLLALFISINICKTSDITALNLAKTWHYSSFRQLWFFWLESVSFISSDTVWITIKKGGGGCYMFSAHMMTNISQFSLYQSPWLGRGKLVIGCLSAYITCTLKRQTVKITAGRELDKFCQKPIIYFLTAFIFFTKNISFVSVILNWYCCYCCYYIYFLIHVCILYIPSIRDD